MKPGSLSSRSNEAVQADPVTSTPPTSPAFQTSRAKNVTVLLRSEESRIELASALKDITGIDFYLLLRPLGVAGPFGRRDVVPDALLVEIDANDAADINYIRALHASGALKSVPIVALTDATKQLAALSAIRAGADDVVLTPINRNDLLEVLVRVINAARATDPANVGRLVTFVHVCGGAGATTLAVNSAAAIAKSSASNGVCLLDLDIQYGNVASLLDITKSSPVDAIIDEPARLDREMFDSMLLHHDSGVEVLTAPRLPFALSSYRSDMIDNLMHLARRRFSVVIADLPVALAPWTDVMLRQSSVIFLVCTPTVTSVHRATQFLRLMEREGLNELPFRIVLNRYQTGNSDAEISAQKFAGAVGRPVPYTVLEDYRLVSASHSQGRPAVALQPSGRFAQQVNAMLSNELGESILKPAKKSWWQ
jgi:pilus assembly protein CpaE